MLYLFAGKFLLLISIKISSLNLFLNSVNTELKTSLFVDFVIALFSKHSAITETHAKGKLSSPNFSLCHFSYLFLIWIYIF